jgi:hypothetical protein
MRRETIDPAAPDVVGRITCRGADVARVITAQELCHGGPGCQERGCLLLFGRDLDVLLQGRHQLVDRLLALGLRQIIGTLLEQIVEQHRIVGSLELAGLQDAVHRLRCERHGQKHREHNNREMSQSLSHRRSP